MPIASAASASVSPAKIRSLDQLGGRGVLAGQGGEGLVEGQQVVAGGLGEQGVEVEPDPPAGRLRASAAGGRAPGR